MKKLIIALLLVPSYALSMRTNTPEMAMPPHKNIETLRSEFETLAGAIAQAQAAPPTQAQIRLQSIGSRLAQLTQDIANAKKHAARQSVRSEVQNKKQNVPYRNQNGTLKEYEVLEQQLSQFSDQLSQLIERSARAASRYQARVQQNRINKERTQQQQQQQILVQQPAQRTRTHNAARATTQARPQVYTIDYTKA